MPKGTAAAAPLLSEAQARVVGHPPRGDANGENPVILPPDDQVDIDGYIESPP